MYFDYIWFYIFNFRILNLINNIYIFRYIINIYFIYFNININIAFKTKIIFFLKPLI